MKNYRNLILSIFAILLLTSCASHYAPETIIDPFGFFSGLWHGAIAGLTITVNVISWLLSQIGISLLQDVQIIGRPNTTLLVYVTCLISLE